MVFDPPLSQGDCLVSTVPGSWTHCFNEFRSFYWLSMTHTIKLNFLSWNVRGLNEKDKRIAVRQTVLLERPHIICFQETKMSLMSDKIIKETCGRRLNQFNTLPAIGTRGGILLAWSSTNFTKLQENSGTFCISVLLKNIRPLNTRWQRAILWGTLINQTNRWNTVDNLRGF